MKLLDFGIAKQLESLDGRGDQTRTALRLMTPAYAAPEQIRGGRIGIYTDVYALGVVLYELITGRLPFQASENQHIETLITAQEPERPSVAARDTTLDDAHVCQARISVNPSGLTSTCCASRRCTRIQLAGTRRSTRSYATSTTTSTAKRSKRARTAFDTDFENSFGAMSKV